MTRRLLARKTLRELRASRAQTIALTGLHFPKAASRSSTSTAPTTTPRCGPATTFFEPERFRTWDLGPFTLVPKEAATTPTAIAAPASGSPSPS